jgi:hypothetical protein
VDYKYIEKILPSFAGISDFAIAADEAEAGDS